MKAIFFATPLEFRKWLEKNHSKKTELIVGFYKVSTGIPSMTWSQSVDEALCYGWIDGIRKSIDEERYQIRFTPRKAGSIWSAVNIEKIKQLKKMGLMKPVGLEIFKNRTDKESGVYSYETEEEQLSSDLEKHFKINKKAWDYFQSLAPSYQKVSKKWVMSAKQDVTRLKRLNELIKDSAAGTNQWKDSKYNKKKL